MLLIGETHSSEQLLSGDTRSLRPKLPAVIAEEHVPALPDGDEPRAGIGDVEQERSLRERSLLRRQRPRINRSQSTRDSATRQSEQRRHTYQSANPTPLQGVRLVIRRRALDGEVV